MKCRLLATILFVHTLLFAQSRAGMDTTFGNKGVITYIYPPDIGFGNNQAFAVAIQPDNKILMGGGASNGATILRFHANGTLDNSFALNGIFTPTNRNYGTVRDILLQNDGKIIAIGNANLSDFFAMRLLPNGTLDSSFGTNGITSAYFYDLQTAMLLPNGKILIAGSIVNNATICRLRPDGIIDSTFGTNGFINTVTVGQFPGIRSIDAMADGRIVLAGDGYDTSFNWTIASLRFLPDGQFDTTYNHTGFKHVYLPGLTYARSMKLQPDGKIIIGGSAGNSGFILRMNVNGSIDTTYGNMGVLEAPLAIRSMLLLPDGKIITGGDNGDWMVGRVKAVGSSVDSTFGRNGSIVNDINNTLYERINQIAVQQDNKIVAVGYTESNDSGRLMAIARYLPDATTKIQTISSIDKFSIYPNPATNELFIKCSDAIPPYYWACTISSIDGRTWYYPFLTPGSTTINISNLPPGTYTIAVHSNNLQYTQLFTKM